MGSDEASSADDEDGEGGVGAAASQASDVVLLIRATTIGTERLVRVGARRRREKEKEAEREREREREKRRATRDKREKKINKIINVSATVTMYICKCIYAFVYLCTFLYPLM